MGATSPRHSAGTTNELSAIGAHAVENFGNRSEA
jgi:hypothetical protein